nr:MAG TPA: hypothetical protein [Caudoviricetes sp.]
MHRVHQSTHSSSSCHVLTMGCTQHLLGHEHHRICC